ncbi:metal ABC transporter solute-binding protein, Zn/Mn family [uncultured Chloroflexus sp.]|uniref:metal ABC transporter solute-binding protein, Zn/Mn family n=1 Tax=uncultured Chloroflexus sp. TaxID=214040 RepID=UPI00260A3FEC|nr:zinc ABC transporter substrate-binding protein [uncultured Chloroflexus sp.]
MHLRLGLIITLTILSLASCATPVSDGRIRVVATTGPISDIVQAIAGERVTLRTMLGPGIDPHTYIATESDLFALQEAALILYNGLHLEANLARVFEGIKRSGRIPVIAVAEAIPEGLLLAWQDGDKAYDPHVWHDPQRWRYAVEAVRDALIAVDPAGSALYWQRSEQYLADLQALDTELRIMAERIPLEQRILVTAHDAFQYFGHAYGFRVEAVQGISTAAEASAADIRALTELVVTHRVPAIFVETSVSSRTIEAVQSAARAVGHEVRIGGELYSDSLGDPDGPAGTYFGMMLHNMQTIVTALAPADT